MNKMKLLVATLMALAAVASSHAITVSASDLILGFNRTSGTGSGNNLEVNLGSAAGLVAASAGAEITLTGLALADLENYGASGAWRNTQTTWGVVGANDTGNNLVWGTVKGGSAVGAPGSQGGVSNKVQSLYTLGAGGLQDQTATANSATASLVLTGAGTNTWKNAATLNLNFGYGVWSSKLVQTTNSLTTVAFQSAELYQFNESSTAVDVGTFKLYNDGTFTFQAIPEPSTYAALLGVMTLGVVAIRRRRQAAMEV